MFKNIHTIYIKYIFKNVIKPKHRFYFDMHVIKHPLFATETEGQPIFYLWQQVLSENPRGEEDIVMCMDISKK